jgi:hypothetical protein
LAAAAGPFLFPGWSGGSFNPKLKIEHRKSRYLRQSSAFTGLT